MTFLCDLAGMIAFRTRALRALSARSSVAAGVITFSVAFLVFVLVRNTVYAELGDTLIPMGALENLLRLNLIQAVLFLTIIYVPAVVVFSNAIAGDGLGLSLSREEYKAHLSVLCPLWGVLFLVAAPVQWLLPQFVVIGILGISIGLIVLVLLLVMYTVWAIRELNYLSKVAALAVFTLSWFTLPLFYLLTSFLFALPLFVLFPLLYLGLQRLRGFEHARGSERDFQQHLKTLTVNPQDADAHYQLGLIHIRRGNLDAARRYLEDAIKIDPNDHDYHYFLGRAFEAKEDWSNALEQYEATYRLNPQYGHGDIFREVGKGYLHTDNADKAIEFFRFFLQDRNSDPEGRYWLAVAYRESGATEDMKSQLRTLLDQARSSPRFFRKENRKWIYRAHILLRAAGSGQAAAPPDSRTGS